MSANVSQAEYHRMIGRIREVAAAAMPAGADVLVVSRGDSALLELPTVRGQHFPQDEQGEYSGYHPEASSDALLHLEEMRTRGAEYLLLPRTSYWWLHHYREFAQYLETRCTRLPTPGDECRIFVLGHHSADPRRTASGGYGEVGQRATQLEAFLASLLPPHARLAVVNNGELGSLRLETTDVLEWNPPDPRDHGDDGALDLCLSELTESGVDFVVVPMSRFEEAPPDSELLGALSRSGHLVAHRTQLGWLFDLAGPQEGPTRAGLWTKESS